MKTRIAMSSGIALMLVVGIFAALLALGTFEAKPAAAAITALDINSESLVVSPADAGAIASYTFTLTVTGTDVLDGKMDGNIGEFRITFDKDTQLPATISRNNVLISASAVSNPSGGVTAINAGGQVLPLSFDPIIKANNVIVDKDTRRKTVIITIPDMVPGDTSGSGGLGVQGIASGGTTITNQNANLDPVEVSTITITFTSAAGIRNAKTAETTKIHVQACPTSSTCTSDTSPDSVTASIGANLTLSGINGGRGTKLTISGSGFKGGTTATVWRESVAVSTGTADAAYGTRDNSDTDLASVIVSSAGTFSTAVVVANPPFAPGDNAIFAQDGEETPASRKMKGSDAGVWELRGSIVVNPKTVTVGETITVQLQDYPAGGVAQTFINTDGSIVSGVTMKMGGVDITYKDGDKATDKDSGNATFTARIPNGISLGANQLRIGGGALGSSTRNTIVTVSGATLDVTPTSALPNQTISIVGNNYTTSEVVGSGNTSRLNTAANDTDDGCTQDSSFLLEGTTILRAKINDGKDISVAAGGNWSASLILPVTNKTATPGTYTLKAIDCLGREGVTSVTIPDRTLTVTPAESRVGAQIIVQGNGFPVRSTKTGQTSRTVEIKYAGTSKTTVTPDAGGSFLVAIDVPSDTNIPSTNTIEARYTAKLAADDTTDAEPVITTTSHRVPRAILTLDPTSGPAGTKVKVTGTGFKNFFTLTSLLFGTADITPSPKPATADTGSFEIEVVAPFADTGTQTVEAKVDVVTASASFLVVASVPTATPSPLAASAAPATALAALISNNDNLQRVWHFDPSKQSVAPDFGWFLYDPRPVFAAANSVDEITGGKFYWVNVREAQTAVLGGVSRALFAGWNPVTW